MKELEKLRIDKYLWSIRLFKTRSLATDACNSGKVKCNATAVKPSKTVNIGDEFEVKTEAKKWVIKVSDLLYNRVQYSEAIKYYIDITPAETNDANKYQPTSFNTGKRLSKVGRPTKKRRRDINDFTEM